MRPKPLLEDHQTLEEYLEALVEWHLDRRFAVVDYEWLRQVGIGWEDEL